MRVQNIIIVLTLLVVIYSCRKDEEEITPKSDFREAYLGEYELYVNSHHWQMGAYDYWIEDTLIGEVFLFDSTQTYDYVQNTASPFTSPTETLNGLTIKFTDYYHSHVYLQEDDTIRWYGGYHYSHSGYFTGDSIYFNVVGLGGLGGGSDYYTKGRKI